MRIVAFVPAVWAVLRALGYCFEWDFPGIDSAWWRVPEFSAALATAGVLLFRSRDRYSALLAFTLCLWPAGQLWNNYVAFWVGLERWRFPTVAGLSVDPRVTVTLVFAVVALLGLYLRYR